MDVLVDVPEDSNRPTVEWSKKLYDMIMETTEEIGLSLHHDRELTIIGQGIDDEVLVGCPAPRGAAVEPALQKIGFDPELVETDSHLQLYRIESHMDSSDF